MTEMTTLEEIDRIVPRAVPTQVGQIPPSVVRAISKVQGGLSAAVAKKGRNTHGSYNYLSVDDLFAALTLHLAEAGLAVITLETGTTEERLVVNSKTVLFVTFVFKFVLATPEGTWTDPDLVRTVRTRVDGPQAYAAAQSFAEKAFLRSLFKVPSGDQELDAVKQAPTIEDQAGVEEPVKPVHRRKSSAAAKRDGDDQTFNRLNKEMEACRDSGELEAIYLEHFVYDLPFGEFPSKWAAALLETYEYRDKDLKAAGA